MEHLQRSDKRDSCRSVNKLQTLSCLFLGGKSLYRERNLETKMKQISIYSHIFTLYHWFHIRDVLSFINDLVIPTESQFLRSGNNITVHLVNEVIIDI